jgi:hypothetical protein
MIAKFVDLSNFKYFVPSKHSGENESILFSDKFYQFINTCDKRCADNLHHSYYNVAFAFGVLDNALEASPRLKTNDGK